MVEFVQKFIDRSVKQKFWFEYGLHVWFVGGLAIGWSSKFPAGHPYPPKKKNLGTPPLPVTV